jgi:hypothetical protein
MSGPDDTGRNARINKIVGVEPAHIGAKAKLDLAAVQITVVDEVAAAILRSSLQTRMGRG